MHQYIICKVSIQYWSPNPQFELRRLKEKSKSCTPNVSSLWAFTCLLGLRSSLTHTYTHTPLVHFTTAIVFLLSLSLSMQIQITKNTCEERIASALFSLFLAHRNNPLSVLRLFDRLTSHPVFGLGRSPLSRPTPLGSL